MLFDRFDGRDVRLGLPYSMVNQRRERRYPGLDPWEFPSCASLWESIMDRLQLSTKLTDTFVEIPVSGSVVKTSFKIPLFPETVAKYENGMLKSWLHSPERILGHGIVTFDFPTPKLIQDLFECNTL